MRPFGRFVHFPNICEGRSSFGDQDEGRLVGLSASPTYMKGESPGRLSHEYSNHLY